MKKIYVGRYQKTSFLEPSASFNEIEYVGRDSNPDKRLGRPLS